MWSSATVPKVWLDQTPAPLRTTSATSAPVDGSEGSSPSDVLIVA